MNAVTNESVINVWRHQHHRHQTAVALQSPQICMSMDSTKAMCACHNVHVCLCFAFVEYGHGQCDNDVRPFC
jgi:hypothetical protein